MGKIRSGRGGELVVHGPALGGWPQFFEPRDGAGRQLRPPVGGDSRAAAISSCKSVTGRDGKPLSHCGVRPRRHSNPIGATSRFKPVSKHSLIRLWPHRGFRPIPARATTLKVHDTFPGQVENFADSAGPGRPERWSLSGKSCRSRLPKGVAGHWISTHWAG